MVKEILNTEDTNNTYYVAHRKIGYIVADDLTLDEARAEKEIYGRYFAIFDKDGNEVK